MPRTCFGIRFLLITLRYLILRFYGLHSVFRRILTDQVYSRQSEQKYDELNKQHIADMKHFYLGKQSLYNVQLK